MRLSRRAAALAQKWLARDNNHPDDSLAWPLHMPPRQLPRRAPARPGRATSFLYCSRGRTRRTLPRSTLLRCLGRPGYPPTTGSRPTPDSRQKVFRFPSKQVRGRLPRRTSTFIAGIAFRQCASTVCCPDHTVTSRLTTPFGKLHVAKDYGAKTVGVSKKKFPAVPVFPRFRSAQHEAPSYG